MADRLSIQQQTAEIAGVEPGLDTSSGDELQHILADLIAVRDILQSLIDRLKAAEGSADAIPH